MRVPVSICLSLIVGVSIAAAVNGAETPAQQPQAAVPQQAISPQPEAAQKTGAYKYSGIDRKDPFTPLVSKREAGREKGISPLEAYDINEEKVIAILWAKNKYYAVFSLPDGKSYTVNEGAKVGTRNGIVTKISKDRVIIKERIRDARGAMSPKDTVLRLRGEEEE